MRPSVVDAILLIAELDFETVSTLQRIFSHVAIEFLNATAHSPTNYHLVNTGSGRGMNFASKPSLSLTNRLIFLIHRILSSLQIVCSMQHLHTGLKKTVGVVCPTKTKYLLDRVS